MGRADELRAYHEAELRVIELEDQLAAAKTSNDGASRELKHELREARAAFRRLRDGEPVADGDAVASPEAIEAKAEVQP